jgi:hypothetical protein
MPIYELRQDTKSAAHIQAPSDIDAVTQADRIAGREPDRSLWESGTLVEGGFASGFQVIGMLSPWLNVPSEDHCIMLKRRSGARELREDTEASLRARARNLREIPRKWVFVPSAVGCAAQLCRFQLSLLRSHLRAALSLAAFVKGPPQMDRAGR